MATEGFFNTLLDLTGMSTLVQASTATLIAHVLIFGAIAVRVIMKRPATGVALAWLFLVATLPFVGAVCYLLFGERRVAGTRARRIAALRPDYDALVDAVIREGLTDVDWSRHWPAARAMDRLGDERPSASPRYTAAALRCSPTPRTMLGCHHAGRRPRPRPAS